MTRAPQSRRKHRTPGALKAEYDKNSGVHKTLLQEVEYILLQGMADRKLKVHQIEGRIKDWNSVRAKAEAKGFTNPLREMVDIVGARVVSLFRSDLAIVDQAIREGFDVLDVDDKISSVDTVGYMSIHYTCKMKSSYKGPRYRDISDLLFEVQSRTLCMHAWAVVSHYLDYKGEWDVPAELKKALNALSGLFYVADNEFEQVYNAKISYAEEAAREVTNEERSEAINLDTIIAYLRSKFSGREHVEASALSPFVRELNEADIKSISQLEEIIDRGLRELIEIEAGEIICTSLAAARISAGLASDDYRRVHYGTDKSSLKKSVLNMAEVWKSRGKSRSKRTTRRTPD